MNILHVHVHVHTGSRTVTLRTSGYRGHTSMMHICNAVGASLPPLYVFQGKRRAAGLLKGAPEGSAYALSESGYFTEENFIHVITYMNTHTPSTPRLLIVDGHTSHFEPAALDLCVASHISLLCLPAHTSHLIQVADLTVFGPFKSGMAESCERYRLQHQHDINKYDMAAITSQPWLNAVRPSNVIAGFKRSGIWPLNKLAVPDKAFKLGLLPPLPSDTAHSDILTVPSSQYHKPAKAPNSTSTPTTPSC